MKGNETRLVEFMDGSKKRFAILVYQRNYDWKQGGLQVAIRRFGEG